MKSIRFRRGGWSVKPPPGVRARKGGIADGLIGCFPLNEEGNVGLNIITGYKYSPVNGAAIISTQLGRMLDCNGAKGIVADAEPILIAQTPVSIFWSGIHLGNPSTNSNYAGVTYTNGDTSPYSGYGVATNGAGAIVAQLNDGSYHDIVDNQPSVIGLNQRNAICLTYLPGSQFLYINNRVQGASYSGTTISYSGPKFAIGYDPNNGSRDSKSYADVVYIWRRAITRSEFLQLWSQPYSIFEPPGSVLYSIPLSIQLVSGSAGISSAESFGSGGSILEDQALTGAAGIPSAAAFGSGGSATGPVTGAAGIPSAAAFGSGGSVALDHTLIGGSGIPSGETFGSGGTLYLEIVGSTGIPTGETFGAGGVVAGPVTGSSGIPSADAFGSGGDVRFAVDGLYGIPSEEAFGAGGEVIGPITGVYGIASGEAFGAAGSVTGPITGVTGIPSGETFGGGGTASITGPVSGSAGIPSAEAFGVGGLVGYLITGTAGIPTAETFGSGGEVRSVIAGYTGIESAEAFGAGGIVGNDRSFHLFIGGRDRVSQLLVNTMSIHKDILGSGGATFTLKSMNGKFVPWNGQEVIYTYGGQILFGGKVVKTKVVAYEGRNTTKVEVTCSDYYSILAGRDYTKTWNGPTLDFRTIMKDIIAVGLSGERITLQDDCETSSITAKRLEFAGDTVDVCFQRMKSAFGYNIWIDANRVVRAERGRWRNAPYVLRDQNTSNGLVEAWAHLEVTRDSSQYRNTQGARTSIPVTGQRTNTFTGDGVTKTWTLSQPATSKPSVYVNDVLKTVVESADRASMPYDFYYNTNGIEIIQNGAAAALTGSDTIRVSYPAANIDIAVKTIDSSVARNALITGDSGIVVANSPARNVRDAGNAEALNTGNLAKYGARSITEATFLSRLVGWDVGQVLHAFVTSPHLFGFFMLKQVEIREVDATFLEYRITLQAPTPPEIIALQSEDNGDGTTKFTFDPGFDTGLNPGDTFTIGGINLGGGSENAVHVTAMSAASVSGHWEITLTVDDWPGTLPGEGIALSNCQIDATGGQGLSFGQPVLRINGGWTIHSVDRPSKTMVFRTALDGNPTVDFSGFVYRNPPDGQLRGAAAQVGSLNGAWTVDTTGPGNTISFNGGQVCNILSVALTAGADPDSWTVRLNLDQIPQAIGGDSVSVSDATHHFTAAALTDQSDRASRQRYARQHGINGLWTLDTVPASPAQYVTFHTNSGTNGKLDLTSYVYDGGGKAGFNASNGNLPIDLGNYTGLPIDTTGSGFYTGVPALPATPEGHTEPLSPAGTPQHRIIAVNNQTREVTTADDHGFTTNYPHPNNDEVRIFGVTQPQSINIAFTRVTVTGPRTFIAEDVDGLALAFDGGFINDGHGVCFNTRQAIVVTSGPVDHVGTLLGVMAGPSSNVQDKATFILANSVPGLPSRPLQPGENQTNPWIAQKDIGVIESVATVVGTPSDGGPVVIDIKQNGVSVFGPGGGLLTIPAGSTEVVRVTEFANNPQVVNKNDKFTVDVVSVPQGEGQFPGCNAVVNMNVRG